MQRRVIDDLSFFKCSKLQEMLPLIMFLKHPLTINSIMRITDDILKSDVDPYGNYEKSWANEAYVLGACLSTLAEVNHQAVDTNIDQSLWIKCCVQHWSWSEFVIKGLADWMKSM